MQDLVFFSDNEASGDDSANFAGECAYRSALSCILSGAHTLNNVTHVLDALYLSESEDQPEEIVINDSETDDDNSEADESDTEAVDTGTSGFGAIWFCSVLFGC